jgi:signal transduction histidine kinase
MELVIIEKAIEEALLIVNIPSKLSVNIIVEKDFPKIKADFPMLKRALINLIQNAVQAMPNGGTLKISAETKNHNAQISIQDTGEGIPNEAQEKLFTPLFTTKSKGQGFGLAVVKRLIEAQNGEVTYKTQKGKGTTFTIQLPIKQ